MIFLASFSGLGIGFILVSCQKKREKRPCKAKGFVDNENNLNKENNMEIKEAVEILEVLANGVDPDELVQEITKRSIEAKEKK